MHTRMEELDLATELWRKVIVHLNSRISRKRQGDTAFDEADDERSECIDAMQREIMLYSLCIDWARDQKDMLGGRYSQSASVQRERFYKLMAALAKSELDRDDHVRSIAFMSSGAASHPSDQEAVDELEQAAQLALERLIAA